MLTPCRVPQVSYRSPPSQGNTHDALTGLARDRQVLERVLHLTACAYAAVQALSERSVGAQAPRIGDLDAAVAIIRCFPAGSCACCTSALADLRETRYGERGVGLLGTVFSSSSRMPQSTWWCSPPGKPKALQSATHAQSIEKASVM